MKRAVTQRLETLFTPGRAQPLFLRISGYKPGLEKMLLDIHEMARQCGVVIEGRLPNPTTENTNFYFQMMGQDFRMEQGFISDQLAKWMQRMNPAQRSTMAAAVFDVLQDMRRCGKTESIIRNAYLRIMCWLYFRFESVAVQLGKGRFPVIFIQATPSGLELNFLSCLCQAGCDIVLLQCQGDAEYLKLDPGNVHSDPVIIEGARAFPPDFSLNAIYRARLEQEKQQRMARPQPPTPAPRPQPPTPAPRQSTSVLRQPMNASRPSAPAQRQTVPVPPTPTPRPQPQARPQPPVEQPLRIPQRDYTICPNIWMTSDVMESILLPCVRRGDEDRYIYTCFVRREGVRERQTYQEELLRLHQKLQENGRSVLVVDEGFAPPTTEETQAIQRRDYRTINEAIMGLAVNLHQGTALDLHNTLVCAFMEVLSEEVERTKMNVQRLISDAVYLLCWFRRVYPKLLANWKYPALGCLIYLGVASTSREALFLRFLSRLPVDLLMLCPDLEQKAKLTDPLMLVQELPESMRLDRFPKEGAMRVSTTASNAEREIREVLGDSGLYHSQQFACAKSVLLESTCDEVMQYWDTELKYRPAFSTTSSTVMMPVLFAQVNGVRHGKLKEYWQQIRKLMTEDTVLMRNAPYFTQEKNAAVCGPATDFLRGGKLQRRRIKEHPHYPFGFMREEMQEHVLDKIQLMIDERIIKGTNETGVEYQVVATILGMSRDWGRRIQKFDFTKKNPKVLCIHAGEQTPSRDDAILLAFLHLVGFDIVGFVPTGYQWVTQWYNKQMLVSHQQGDYLYDLTVPELSAAGQGPHSIFDIFKRGS